MNIDHAKAIPIAKILVNLNIHPVRINRHKLLYPSPIREEKTHSFWIDIRTNRWHDFGDDRGGDLIDLACAYLKFTREEHTISDALRWIKNMALHPFEFAPIPAESSSKEEMGLVLKTKGPIQQLGLIHYLKKRGIPLELAHQHLKEIHVRNPSAKKSFFVLGFANEEGGYELQNPFFKGSLGTKAISFVRGRDPKPDAIHLFEGFLDYLSAVSRFQGRGFKGDTVILNSLACLKHIAPYIQNYGYRFAYSWLDNDEAGRNATASLAEFCKTQDNLTCRTMNRFYAPFKDVNAWHMHSLGLTP